VQGELLPLDAGTYEAEEVLQDLLEHHPQLLAGAQMSRADPRRFILVRREAPIPDHEGGAGRWSVDHLFVDQDAVPTLVEVKRSTDTRIRREVVGQMLDYAANGVQYWTPDALSELFERTCQSTLTQVRDVSAPLNSSTTLAALLGEDADVDEFWSRVGQNLRAGRLRLVFVADVIPAELRAIIDFLGKRFYDTQVFGVEVRRYADTSGRECFVSPPRRRFHRVSSRPGRPTDHSPGGNAFQSRRRRCRCTHEVGRLGGAKGPFGSLCTG
jgi:hypothetical protein